MSRVGFIGLGLMGEGMSRQLLGAGRTLLVWNRSVGKATALQDEAGGDKVVVASTPAEVIKGCDLTYCMLSTPDAVKEVYEMENGVLAGVSDGKSIVDCATLSEADMVRISGQVVERGGKFLEAPVSGSKGPAAAGQLIFLAAGDESIYSSITADLDAMGKASFHFGEVGAGTRMKLTVNMIMGSMLASFGEGISLAQSSGLDASKLLEVLDLGVMSNAMFRLKGKNMVEGTHAGTQFPLKHAEKDMRLAVELGAQNGLELPVASAADAAMVRSMDAGLADADFSATVEAQKKK